MFRFKETENYFLVKERFRFQFTRLALQGIFLFSWIGSIYLLVTGSWGFYELLIWIFLTGILFFPLSSKLIIKFKKVDSKLYINYTYFPFICKSLKLNPGAKFKFTISQNNSKRFFSGNYYKTTSKHVSFHLNGEQYVLTVVLNKEKTAELKQKLDQLTRVMNARLEEI